jgi:hypothetical protein
MDIPNLLIAKAAEMELHPLPSRNLQHRLSIYADDVILFLRPAENELQMGSLWPQNKYDKGQHISHPMFPQ